MGWKIYLKSFILLIEELTFMISLFSEWGKEYIENKWFFSG